MINSIVHFFSHFHPALATFIMATLPGIERFALPVAVLGYHLHVWLAMVLAILGHMVPITIILLFADRFHKWISSHSLFGRTWVKALNHAQKKFASYEKYGLIGLAIFIAIPLPFNGGYTGAVIAFLLGVPFRKAWPYLFAGVVAATLIIAALTVGIDKIF